MRYSGFTEVSEKHISIKGIDFGCIPTIVDKEPPFYVVHTIGHMAWAGIAMRRYYPPYYYVVQLSTKKIYDDEPPRSYGTFLEEYQSGRNWRTVKANAIERMHELAKEFYGNTPTRLSEV